VALEHDFFSGLAPFSRTLAFTDPDRLPRDDVGRLARKVGNGYWTVVPPAKIEHDRESPDGRSHLCSRRLDRFFKIEVGNVVLCFIPGTGF
jgi:hypothetical protein